MVEIGEWLELDVEGMLLAIGVETSAVTGSVGILLMRDSEVQVLLDEDKGRRGTL